MAYFLMKLIPPRKTFPGDMTDVERELMQKHNEYWKVFVEKGVVIILGPVMDPDGPYGVGILEVESETVAQTLAENDPVIKADAGFHAFVSLMPAASMRDGLKR